MYSRLKYDKTWTSNFVYVPEVLANTLQPSTSKSPRRWREHPCFYSWSSLNFGEISGEKILSWTLQFLYVLIACLYMS
jgi:hypothetical protein